MQRTVAAQGQLLCYELTHKRVKNLNLRLGPAGDIRVSAPKWVALEQIDAFVISRSGWISTARRRFSSINYKVNCLNCATGP